MSKNLILQAQRSIPKSSSQSSMKPISLAFRRISMVFLFSSPPILVIIENLILSLSLGASLRSVIICRLLKYYKGKFIPHQDRSLTSTADKYPLAVLYVSLDQQNQNMFSNRGRYSEKIAQVISISSNYKRHYDNLANVKPAVDFSDHKHMKKVLQLSTEKDRYTNNVRKLRLNELKKENQSVLKRIKGIGSPVRNTIAPKLSPQGELPKTLEHNSSNKSLISNCSDASCGSNFRRRTLRQKQIERENKVIAQRIMNPKMAKQTNKRTLTKFYQQEQSYSRIRSRYSNRSQSIMQSLAFGGLKLQRRNVQFLPQLSFKRLDQSLTNKTLTVRPGAHRPQTKKNMTAKSPTLN